MNTIVLKNRTDTGEPLQATFLPDMGMNMISYKRGAREVIDQSTRPLFDERFAGLGALIGPHFHRRNPAILPPIADESLFPHIARVKAKGVADPFSHGIARYAPWKATATENTFTATLTGKDLWNGIPLSALEGQNFTINFRGEMSSTGLQLSLTVVSDTDSLMGIHYYYHLPQGRGSVISGIQKEYMDQTGRKPLPPDWPIDGQQIMTFDLSQEADYTFFPYPNPREGVITLDAIDYRLVTSYSCASQENCWQLYHPKGASFVCMEPISSQDPRHPNLSVSSIDINLQIR